ncbi:MAG: DNA2/NAM7 family helicase [Planctomycetes bacterium]|nr:DNA2/NAM7 family helicase [Planctomycetota bacterium]
MTAAERELGAASTAVAAAAAAAYDVIQAAESVRVEMNKQSVVCERLPTAEALKEQLTPIEGELEQTERRLTELRARLDALEKEVIAEARVVAATLTKCYAGDQLDAQDFDALIVDEISMALPPLLFVACRRALRRVILVGDFKQLPPIVRSDAEISDQRLATDAFRLAGLTDDHNNLRKPPHTCVARLCTQRRMLPPIADVARRISYEPSGLLDDSWEIEKRRQEHGDSLCPRWLAFLEAGGAGATLFDGRPSNALIIVDTADLHAWCGRQAGSLSRFNLYSAQIAVELAAMAAAGIPKPEQINAPPIGIVTPYAAQRRLLSRLIQALELQAWVAVGTVHTFQGGEADLIIFDTVLDEPYWTARLCNPNQSNEVKRDLNVAVTRAKSKFVLVGSSEWLNRHAKPTSGLGQLWHHLKEHATLVPAHEILSPGIACRVAGTADGCSRRRDS